MKGDLSNIKTHETHFNFYLWKKRSHRKIKLVKRSSGCWECVSHAQDDKGYPKTRLNYGTYRIFRIMYGIFKNDLKYYIPKNFVVRHLCSNSVCCNPEHLTIGTHVDNMNDLKEKNQKIKECNLTEQDISYIKASSMDATYLADVLGVPKTAIEKIKNLS